jgi:hypothetical protein
VTAHPLRHRPSFLPLPLALAGALSGLLLWPAAGCDKSPAPPASSAAPSTAAAAPGAPATGPAAADAGAPRAAAAVPADGGAAGAAATPGAAPTAPGAPAAAAPAAAPCSGTFAGRWKTPIGLIRITLDGDKATGRYPRGGFTGKVSEGGKRLDADFKYIGMTGNITYLMAPGGKTATASYKTSLRQQGSYVATCVATAGDDDD